MYNKIFQEDFPDMVTLLETIDNRPNNSVMRNKKSSHSDDAKFTGTESYDQAVDYALHGWDEKLSEIKSQMKAATVASNVTRSKTRPQLGVIGYAPCVPNAILGLPQSMVSTERTPQKVKAISIALDVNVNASWKTERMMKCGIAALQLVNDLELSGYRVNLKIEFITGESSRNLARATVTVKHYRQPLDLKKLAFPLANPSMLRRIGFKWLETVPNLEGGYSSGYGTPIANDGYAGALKKLNENNILGANEYFINYPMIEECEFDTDKMMEKAGMNSLKKKGA